MCYVEDVSMDVKPASLTRQYTEATIVATIGGLPGPCTVNFHVWARDDIYTAEPKILIEKKVDAENHVYVKLVARIARGVPFWLWACAYASPDMGDYDCTKPVLVRPLGKLEAAGIAGLAGAAAGLLLSRLMGKR